jgi:hypothetical protein
LKENCVTTKGTPPKEAANTIKEGHHQGKPPRKKNRQGGPPREHHQGSTRRTTNNSKEGYHQEGLPLERLSSSKSIACNGAESGSLQWYGSENMNLRLLENLPLQPNRTATKSKKQ